MTKGFETEIMTTQDDIGLKQLESDVIEFIEGLEAMDYTNPVFGIKVAHALATDESTLDAFPSVSKKLKKKWKDKKPVEIENDLNQTTLEANRIVGHKNIRVMLCPALKSISSDAIEIAKAITPILAGASLARTIVIPLDPFLFAVMALIIARMGIASFCSDYDKREGKKE